MIEELWGQEELLTKAMPTAGPWPCRQGPWGENLSHSELIKDLGKLADERTVALHFCPSVQDPGVSSRRENFTCGGYVMEMYILFPTSVRDRTRILSTTG